MLQFVSVLDFNDVLTQLFEFLLLTYFNKIPIP